jgi:lipid-A-disaccharide synthase
MLDAVQGSPTASPRDALPEPARAPGVNRAVAAELTRAGLDGLLLPLRSARFLMRARDVRTGVLLDLSSLASVEDPGPPLQAPERPLRIFLSSAEPSGEQHAAALVHALRAELERLDAPPPRFLALGGERTRALGIETVGDPLERAAMGAKPLGSVPFYAGLLRRAGEHIARFQPDVLVPVDSPALHLPLARIARPHARRIVHLVAPQYWAWAPWRVQAYRKVVDLALTILPFERAWFVRNHVRAAFIGHPELAEHPAVPEAERAGLVLLPGSRASVVDRNLPWMLARALELRARHPNLKVAVLHDRPEREAQLRRHLAAAGAEGSVRLAIGDLHGELARARAALSVSGTILIDLLQHRIPTAVIYRLDSALAVLAKRLFLTVPSFSSVNLVAGRSVFWEACFRGPGPASDLLGNLERILFDDGHRRATREALEEVARRLGPPGAVQRAARFVLGEALAT